MSIGLVRLHHVFQFSKQQNSRWEALNQCFPTPFTLDSIEWIICTCDTRPDHPMLVKHDKTFLVRFLIYISSNMSNQPNQGFFFHVHDNPDLPWWNLTPLSASIAADVAANQWWVLFPAPGAASQAVPRPFICVITMQCAEIRHTVQVTSLTGMWAFKKLKEYTKGREGVCVFAFLFVFKRMCVLSWVRAVECQNCGSLAQTLLAALHSNQIAHHEAQHVSALKFSQVKSHVGWS